MSESHEQAQAPAPTTDAPESPPGETPAEDITDAVVVPDNDGAPEHDAGVKTPEPKRAPAKRSPAKGKRPPKMSAAERFADAASRNRDREKQVAAARKAGAKLEANAVKRANDPELRLAHEATALATGGSVSKDGALTVGETKFGAAVNTTQVHLVKEAVKGKNILQALGGVSESKLRAYAKGEIKQSDLPEETRAALKAITGKFPPKSKMWARKTAVIAAVLHAERKKASRPAKAAPKAAPLASASKS